MLNKEDIISFSLFNNIFNKYDINNSLFFQICIIIYFLYSSIPRYYQYQLIEYVSKIFNNEGNSVTLEYSTEKDTSSKFIAVAQYINKNCPDVKQSKEIELYEWTNSNERVKTSFYQVSQYEPFLIDKKRKLYGKYRFKEIKERTNNGDHTKVINKIIIFSKQMNNKEITEWINKVNSERLENIIHKFKENQYIIKITSNEEITTTKFQSNANFKNTYLPFGKEALSKLKFFLNNKNHYQEKGIPYTLGFLLSGEPGCGKTRYIKMMLNETKRHGLYLVLDDDFDMDYLEQIMHGNISNEIQLDPSEFIVIIEDIDTFTNSFNSREEKEKEKEDNEDNKDKKSSRIIKKKNYSNLGHFLNIMDGIMERTGGITCFTTNYPEKLDSALTRTGRCDMVVKCEKYTSEQVHQLCLFYWKKQYNYKLEQVRKDIHKKYNGADLYEIFKTANMKFENIKDKIIES